MLGRLLSFREGLFFEGRLQVYQFLATWPTHPPPAIRISCFRIPKRPRMELLQWRSEWFTARFFETKQHLQADHQIYLNHATSSGENLTSAHSKLFFFQSNFCPMIKAKSCGTSSEGYRRNREHFPGCFNMEGRRWTLGKDPHTIHETNGIFTYMNGWFFMVNVGEYSIDGCYGINIWKRQLSHWEFGRYM